MCFPFHLTPLFPTFHLLSSFYFHFHFHFTYTKYIEHSFACLLQSLKNVPWFKERTMSEISLGGLLILVVIRTIQYNIARMRVS